MKKGKIIVIEGTDCSGKETQSNILKENLIKLGYKVFKTSYPRYDTPTGKMIGGSLLGKDTIGPSFFEHPGEINPFVGSLFYAADRLFNNEEILKYLDLGYIVILDRYTQSNMAFQGGKIEDKEKRLKMYQKIDQLEFELCELPRPNKVIFLYMPYKEACELKINREEKPDEVEKDELYLKRGENAYLELASIYGFEQINCVQNNKIKSIEEISKEVLKKVEDYLK